MSIAERLVTSPNLFVPRIVVRGYPPCHGDTEAELWADFVMENGAVYIHGQKQPSLFEALASLDQAFKKEKEDMLKSKNALARWLDTSGFTHPKGPRGVMISPTTQKNEDGEIEGIQFIAHAMVHGTTGPSIYIEGKPSIDPVEAVRSLNDALAEDARKLVEE